MPLAVTLSAQPFHIEKIMVIMVMSLKNSTLTAILAVQWLCDLPVGNGVTKCYAGLFLDSVPSAVERRSIFLGTDMAAMRFSNFPRPSLAFST